MKYYHVYPSMEVKLDLFRLHSIFGWNPKSYLFHHLKDIINVDKERDFKGTRYIYKMGVGLESQAPNSHMGKAIRQFKKDHPDTVGFIVLGGRAGYSYNDGYFWALIYSDEVIGTHKGEIIMLPYKNYKGNYKSERRSA